ncbi:MAG: Cobalt-zinc-cadmium resistance protein CzcA [Myxococcales bacterium]|nr:Cobalt-zinc-cadmium resistance protein CzcA [Myxococcales bacterium]
MSLGGWVARHGKGIALAVALLVLGGVLSYGLLARGLYPELAFPRVIVVATLPDATTDVVLLNVTRPLEEALSPVLGVQRVRSKTIRGAAEISLQFDPSSEMVTALQLVQAKLTEARNDLPAGTSVVAERLTPTSFPVLTVSVEGALPPEKLRDLALYQVRPALSRVAGVGPITVTAGEVREAEVEVDPSRAEAAGLTADVIAQKLAATNKLVTVGRADVAYRRYAVVVSGLAPNVARLGDLVVGGSERAPVKLADVATIREGHADPLLLVRSPRGASAVVNVARRIGGDVVALDEGLRAALDRLRGEMPTGVVLTPVYEQATLIGAATGAVRDAILIGALLSALVMLIFLRSSRATLVAAMAIPSSLVAACAIIYITGGSLNLMSLGGLAIAVGLVIDDAVVVVEAIHRELGTGKTPREAAVAGTSLLAGPVVSSTLTTVVVFAPLGLLSGVVGAFFAALAVALAAAVILSLVIALTVIPMLAAALLKPGHVAGDERLSARYVPLLRKGLRRRRAVLAVTVVLVALGAVAASRVESGFIPELDEGAFVLDFFTPIGTSLDEADRLTGQIDELLKADPDIETWSRRLGAELGPPAATEASRGDYIVRLKSGKRDPIDDVMERLRKQLAVRAPGVRVELIQVLQDMLADLEGSPEPIEVKLFGDDEPELRRQAKRVADAIKDVGGLVDLFDGQVACSPLRLVTIDPLTAGRLGLTADAVASQLRAALVGIEATPLPQQDRLLPVRVRWDDRARFDPAVLERVRLRTPAGTLVPLGGVARFEDRCASSEITRENLRLMVAVTARLEGTDLGTAVAEVSKRIGKIDLPRGYSFEIGGQKLSQRRAFTALAEALAAALALVLLVLVFQFGGFAPPLAILAATPIALTGGLVALLVTGTALNVSSLLGAILLVGLVVKNGILLLHRAEERRAEGLSLEDALADAGAVRLRPILMTTLCTLVGLVPLAFGLGAGAEMHRPLAVAVIGGLVLSTPATLFVVPALYAWWARRGEDV